MAAPASTPQPPYYAVIFTSIRTDGEGGYGEAAKGLMELAAQQPGFLGAESARHEIGITVSYWATLEAIKAWKENLVHRQAQGGRTTGTSRSGFACAGWSASTVFRMDCCKR